MWIAFIFWILLLDAPASAQQMSVCCTTLPKDYVDPGAVRVAREAAVKADQERVEQYRRAWSRSKIKGER